MPETIGRNPLSDVERRAFSRKLAGWARTLAPREQDFLVALLRAAGSSGEDTAGHVLAMASLALVPPLPARHDAAKNAISNVR